MKNRYLAIAAVVIASAIGSGVSAAPPKVAFVAKADSLSPAPTVTPAPAAPTPAPVSVPEKSPAPPQTEVVRRPVSGFVGVRGWVAPGNNCVAFVRSYTGRGQSGNAGSWYSTSSSPYLGAIMIFRPGQQGASGQGHVGVVVGIYGDGSVELAHANWPGQTHFRSTGLFF